MCGVCARTGAVLAPCVPGVCAVRARCVCMFGCARVCAGICRVRMCVAHVHALVPGGRSRRTLTLTLALALALTLALTLTLTLTLTLAPSPQPNSGDDQDQADHT